jgi:hypothetical protein
MLDGISRNGKTDLSLATNKWRGTECTESGFVAKLSAVWNINEDKVPREAISEVLKDKDF